MLNPRIWLIIPGILKTLVDACVHSLICWGTLANNMSAEEFVPLVLCYDPCVC